MSWVYRRPPRPRYQRKLTPTLFSAVGGDVVTATAVGHAAASSTTTHNVVVNATGRGESALAGQAVGVRIINVTASGHATPNSTLNAFAAQYTYPTADQLIAGWDTQPTPGQNLFDQLDEDPASDTDFIEELV